MKKHIVAVLLFCGILFCSPLVVSAKTSEEPILSNIESKIEEEGIEINNAANSIIEILETIEWGEHDLFWYIDNKEEAAEYLIEQIEE